MAGADARVCSIARTLEVVGEKWALLAVREVFPNCPRYIHKRSLVERSRFVPATGLCTPVPAWKRSDWAADVVPDGDPARDPARPSLKR